MELLAVLAETIIVESEVLAQKFVNKVESGRTRSVETYRDCKKLLELHMLYKKNLNIKQEERLKDGR